jgi:hypothetical protein
MLHLFVSLLFIVVFNNVCLVAGWNPANFSFNPGDNYEIVWQDEFENVGPVQAIINGQPAYAPNPKNWIHRLGYHLDDGVEKYTDSIQNAYVQNSQLTILVMEDGYITPTQIRYTTAMLSTETLQEFTFGMFAAKIRVPYGRGLWPAFWMEGKDHRYNLSWPTTGEIDILEMYGGTVNNYTGDLIPHATVHWNNESDTMNPMYHKYIGSVWRTPDGSMLHNNSLVYWAEWTPTNISIGINEFTYFQINTTNMIDSINPVIAFSGLFPYCIRLDIAITPKPPGPPDNTTVLPQQMIVDWVRVYQQKKTLITQDI